MKTRAKSITPSIDRIAVRREHLRDALGNAALEGIIPDHQAMADLNAVVDEAMTADEYRMRVKAKYGV